MEGAIQLIDAIRVKIFVADVFLAINCALIQSFIIYVRGSSVAHLLLVYCLLIVASLDAVWI